MAKQARNGIRKSRPIGQKQRPKLGHYIIITDTKETEHNYFIAIRENLPDDLKKKLVIKVRTIETKSLVSYCLEQAAKELQYREPWIVFDRDQVEKFDKIIEDANYKGINVGWSNPCLEIWFDAYFGEIYNYQDSVECCRKFGETYKKKTGKEYKKADKDIYKILNNYGDEEKAISIASKRHKQHISNGIEKPSDMCPCTTVYNLVSEINTKITKYTKN